MQQITICSAGNSAATDHAMAYLRQRGIDTISRPEPDATHLLLPVPSFGPDGRIRGGGVLEHILPDLPRAATVIGGRLDHPALEGYHRIDLLNDGQYLAKNAAITADCAIRTAAGRLPVTWQGCPVLILGWGRIGKCLSAQLQAMGAAVTVATQKSADRDILTALGYAAADPATLRHSLIKFRVLFNTVPSPIMGEDQLRLCRRDCIKLELASQPGLSGKDIIPAPGLPGKLTPETSGQLIAQTILRLIAGKEGGQ